MVKLYREKKYKGKVYPTGEFSFGMDCSNYVTERNKSREYERIYALQHHDLLDDEGSAWMRLSLDEAEVYCPQETLGQEKRLLLGLSTLRNQHNHPSRYGQKGITPYGKRIVKSAAYLLEEEFGKQNLTFATYTIPPLPEDFRVWLHENWNIFVKELMQEIKRELERKNAQSQDYVVVSEIQEDRWRAYGQVYLHLHAVWVGRENGRGHYISTERSDEIFKMVLLRMVSKFDSDEARCGWGRDIYFGAAGRLERVKRTVVGYLGKYLTKGGKVLREIRDSGGAADFPRQWWAISRALRGRVKGRILDLSHEVCDAIANEEEFREATVQWAVPIQKTWQDTVYTLGWVGRFHPGWETLLEASELEHPPAPPSEPQGTLDASAKLRFKRRRCAIDRICPRFVRRRTAADVRRERQERATMPLQEEKVRQLRLELYSDDHSVSLRI